MNTSPLGKYRIDQMLMEHQTLLRHTHDSLPGLFDLSAGIKEGCNMINSPSFLGYTRLGAETTASRTDLREVCCGPTSRYDVEGCAKSHIAI